MPRGLVGAKLVFFKSPLVVFVLATVTHVCSAHELLLGEAVAFEGRNRVDHTLAGFNYICGREKRGHSTSVACACEVEL